MKVKKRELRKYQDSCFVDLDWIIHILELENRRQIEKWGIQIHSAFEWLTYTAEELGSLAKAISECEYRGGDRLKVVSEAIQVATLALKIAEMFKESKEDD
jgi:hypothetical protein